MFVDFNILNQLGSPSINSNTFANRPAAGQTGRLFVSTDTFEIYRDNGTTWDLIGGPGSSTITGTGTATQVAYFTSSQAIGSSANLFWDNTSGFLGVATATPTARIEAVKTDGVGIYANYTTNAGSGSSATALWAKNVTNGSGFSAVIEETTPNTTAGQYPLLIKHSLSSGTAGVGMGTGIHWQLPDDAGTFKTTQLTIETINAAAATYATRYRFNVQSNGSSTPVAYINSTGLGIFTATPGVALDIHSTGIMAHFNTTSATGNTYIAFQRTGTNVWRLGDQYNAGANFFQIHNTALSNNAIEIDAATNKSIFTALQTYTTGLARGNYFDYNLSVSAGGSFSSPNAITALGASLDLTLAGSATIPSGARSGLDAYNSIGFTGTGTLTHNQGTQIRAYSNVTAGWAFNGSATGTVTHLAGLRALFPDNTGSAVTVTNNYALLLNDQTANTGTVTYTNRWGVYQEGASDLNYMAANLLLGSTTNSGEKLQVTPNAKIYNTSGNSTLTISGTGNPFKSILNLEFTASTYGSTLTYDANPEIVTLENYGRSSSSSNSGSIFFRTKLNNTTPTDVMVLNAYYGTLLLGGTSLINSNFKQNITTNSGLGAILVTPASDGTVPLLRAINAAQTVNVGEIGTKSGTSLYFSTNAVERITINNIGDIYTNGNTLWFGASNTADFFVSPSTGYFYNEYPTSYGLIWRKQDGTEAMRITGTNVLIGTTTDSGEKLQVNGTVKCNDLTLGANYSNTYTTDATWSSAQTVIPTNTMNVNGVYLIKLKWVTTAGGSPYNCNTAFLICPANCNGGGIDNTVTPIISTHQGGTGTIIVNMIAGGSQVSAGLQVTLNGFANYTGSLDVTATILKT